MKDYLVLDLFILITLIIFSSLGFFRGFKKEIRSLINLFLFIILSYFFAKDIGNYSISFLNLDLANYPKSSNLIIGFILTFIISTILSFIFSSMFQIISQSLNNIILDRILGLLFGLFKGTIIFILFIAFVDYFNYLDLSNSLYKNSFFMEFFFKFGVQLEYVWNHWNT